MTDRKQKTSHYTEAWRRIERVCKPGCQCEQCRFFENATIICRAIFLDELEVADNANATARILKSPVRYRGVES